jgi:hypothetical protein
LEAAGSPEVDQDDRPPERSVPARSPCRLFVYLARKAPVAVVLRRGPTDWARLSVWRTDLDTFDHGQWIKGRIYERRSDVSSDGSLFAAFVRQSGGGRPGQQPRADSWVAISRPPYFTALALWFVGGTYHTGAFFPDDGSFWAGFGSAPPDIGKTPPWLKMTPPKEISYVDGTAEWTDRTVHFNRLLRDGWTRIENETSRTKWLRTHPALPMTLAMSQRFESFQNYGGPYVVEYTVRSQPDNAEISLGTPSWADWDQQGRLILARHGQLLAWSVDRGEQIIADFNDQAPDPAAAPDWAQRWPTRESV